MRNALSGLFTPYQLEALGIDLNARAENLSIADYSRLANWLCDNPPVEQADQEIDWNEDAC